MLKSYEATMENGQIHWLNEQPEVTVARIIVTVLADAPTPVVKRRRLLLRSLAKDVL